LCWKMAGMNVALLLIALLMPITFQISHVLCLGLDRAQVRKYEMREESSHTQECQEFTSLRSSQDLPGSL